jgi:tRNA-2-methylthio-N6-dimethylallyladenosine synthase
VNQLTGRTMTDHIAVFDGTDRLIGQTVTVDVTDASAFTLYGTVRTTETIGADAAPVSREAQPSAPRRRIGLELV